jgi:hypothetical protein
MGGQSYGSQQTGMPANAQGLLDQRFNWSPIALPNMGAAMGQQQPAQQSYMPNVPNLSSFTVPQAPTPTQVTSSVYGSQLPGYMTAFSGGVPSEGMFRRYQEQQNRMQAALEKMNFYDRYIVEQTLARPNPQIGENPWW